MNLTVGSSSAFASKMLFLFSFAVIVLVNKNVNATLVTSTTTTTTKTTIIEEYDEGDSLGPGDVVKTNDYQHGSVRGSSSSNNYHNEAYKEDEYAANVQPEAFELYETNAAGVAPQPEAIGRVPMCESHGASCGGLLDNNCCYGLYCILKEIKYGTLETDVWKCDKECKRAFYDDRLPCEESNECCLEQGLICRKMTGQKYGYCGDRNFGSHGSVCDAAYTPSLWSGDDSYKYHCKDGHTCYVPPGYEKPVDNRPERATRCQRNDVCDFSSLGSACKYDADCCSPSKCSSGVCAM